MWYWTEEKFSGKSALSLLKLHEGKNATIFMILTLSCMNYYEFASGYLAGIFHEHHFKGFFGKIPWMKKLKRREVFIFKGLIGTLLDKNNVKPARYPGRTVIPRGNVPGCPSPILKQGSA